MTDEQDEFPVQPDEHRPRKDADKGREPQFVRGRMGSRFFSLAALTEKVEVQFYEEHGSGSPALSEADTTTKRLRLILDVVNYTLTVESITLGAEDKAELVRRAYSSLFGYGPLDPFFLDDAVTTIAIEGVDKVSVRHGTSALTTMGPLFDDAAQLRRVIGRLLVDAGAELRDDTPILETGLLVDDRPVRISIVSPPYAASLNADIRVHPRSAPQLDDLVSNGFMNADAADSLRMIARSKYGFCIVGEPESGKTILLNALVNLIPAHDTIIIERAAELRPPAEMRRYAAHWRTESQEERTFGQQIGLALEQSPACLILDEIRSDEPESIAPLLERDTPLRQIWAIRGVPDSKRLQSALGMLARRANMAQSEQMVARLYDRLPFVITVARVGHPETGTSLRLFSVAEWQSRADSDYPDYRLLMQFRDGEARRTEAALARWLD
ncbi:MAG: ATPase, T2SS/T4P/T4SS family [Anaerolineae bacterium]